MVRWSRYLFVPKAALREEQCHKTINICSVSNGTSRQAWVEIVPVKTTNAVTI